MASSFVRRGAFAGVLALCVLPATSAAHGAPPEGGDSQSPIDIRDGDVIFVDDLPDIRFQYPDAALEVINTGSPGHEATVPAVLNTPATIRVQHTTYRLTQFHFHTASEHLLNGEEFPLELHLVHEASLLVLGVLIESGDRHRELRRIFRHLPADETETRVIKHFDLGELMPDHGLARATELLRRAAAAAPWVGRPIYGGLASLGFPGHPLGDRWGLPARSYTPTRGWSADDMDAGFDRLQRRGLMTDDEQLTDAGRAFREEVEVRTDELERPLLEALGDDLDELLDHLDAWSEAVIDHGSYPQRITGVYDVGGGPHFGSGLSIDTAAQIYDRN